MRERGLEPLRPKTPDPKSGAYANFATPARLPKRTLRHMATKDEQAMDRIEADIRATRARIDVDANRVEMFVDAWRGFVEMFTVTNAKDKAAGLLGSVVGEAGDKAQDAIEKVMGIFKRASRK